MSTPLEEPPEPATRGRPRFVLAMRALAGLSALVALIALFSVERVQLAHDLQLAADPDARPGEQLALRALVFRDVDAPEGPTLARTEATVRLLDPRDREVARTELVATPLDTLDGSLTVPSSAEGRYVLEATAELSGEPLRCRRVLTIARTAPPVAAHGREAGPLQQLSLGRVRSPDGALPPVPLAPRVVGGACVPEQPCTMLVWSGAPAASLALEADPRSVTVIAGPSSGAEAREGIVALTIEVHGPEAQVTLRALREGKSVGERALRLPIALGEPALLGERSIVASGEGLVRVVPPPGRTRVIFDVFANGRWRDSRVVEASASRTDLIDVPLGALPEGLVHVQVRTDPFSAESAGARVLYVRSPGEPTERVLARLAAETADRGRAEREGATTAWAEQLPAFAREQPDRTAAYLLAPLEQLRMPVPRALSGRPQALAALDRTRAVARYGVAGALVLSALVIGLSIARRGLSATDEAEAILHAASGDERLDRTHAQARERVRARVGVVLLVLAVAAAFLAGALLIVAKPLWF